MENMLSNDFKLFNEQKNKQRFDKVVQPAIDHSALFNMFFTLIFAVTIFGNSLLAIYLVISKVKTSVDKVLLNISLAQLLLVIFGVPCFYEKWMGESYQYGKYGCMGINPIFSVLELVEALSMILFAVLLREKIKGEIKLCQQIFVHVFVLYVSAIVINIPYFGVIQLEESGEKKSQCIETWSKRASVLFHVVKLTFQFFIPCFMIFFCTSKSFRSLREMSHSIGTTKAVPKYKSFSKVVAETIDHSEPYYLKFTESEELNLEMNQIYETENSISSVRKNDDDTCSVNVQIFRNEIKIEKITSNSPLWRGEKPESLWKQESEYQQLIMSIKWFKYVRNLFKVCSIISSVFLLTQLPYIIMIIYSLFVPPVHYNSTERTIAKVVLGIRYLSGVFNPWLILFGVVRYRKSICKLKNKSC